MMAVHNSHAMFDHSTLIDSLLQYRWQHECTIIPGYQPDGNGLVKCVIVYENNHAVDQYGMPQQKQFLRYSKGPLPGTFWDIYGDDFHSPEIALIALSKAAPPTLVGAVVPTYGKAYFPYS
jgi:hypothetical protein